MLAINSLAVSVFLCLPDSEWLHVIVLQRDCRVFIRSLFNCTSEMPAVVAFPNEPMALKLLLSLWLFMSVLAPNTGFCLLSC